MSDIHHISAFYKFTELTDLESIKKSLEDKAEELNIRGLLILGHEGFNTTCSSPSLENLTAFKTWIQDFFQVTDIFFKDSYANSAPFRRYKVKIRDEIVTTGIPEMRPPEGINHHLSPTEWNQVLKNEKDIVMIDTRNWYEYQIGTFKGAINPDIEKFTDFPEFMEKQGIKKDQKMLIFCTGGIRCEKGILELQKQGYDNVFQLEGGILNYLKEYPNDEYTGECFVFDHRVAVDQNLAPSTKYKLCPHCGQPADELVTCIRCDHQTCVCQKCQEVEIVGQTCSKNCENQWRLHPGKKGARQLLPFELESLAAKQPQLKTDELKIQISKKSFIKLGEKGLEHERIK